MEDLPTEAVVHRVGVQHRRRGRDRYLDAGRHRRVDGEGEVLSDADLAILAASEARYEEYAAAVRVEYSHVLDDDFRAGRAAVLRDLAAKPHLFHTAYARAHWEQPARANLARELARLAPT